MPRPADPLKREFYVYQMEFYPFYVGIGRAKRGNDRMRYTRNLLTRHPTMLQQKSLSVRVLAELLKRNKIWKCRHTNKSLTRPVAVAIEKKRITRLIKRGYVLTNWQHNPHRHLTRKWLLERYWGA